MAVTLATLTLGVKSLLDEQGTSALGATKAGDNTADLETTDAAITRLLNDGQDILAETTVLLPVTSASLAVAANARTSALSALVPSGSLARSVRAVRDVVWTPTATGTARTLTYVDYWAIKAYDRNHENAASGTLSKWYHPGGDEGQIGYYLPPNGAGGIVAKGYGYPVLITSGVSFSWAPDIWGKALEYYAAGMLALKGASDPENAIKESRLLQEWNTRRVAMLSEQDAAVAKRFLRRDVSLAPAWEIIDRKTAGR